jgi:hypothetical protein
MLMPRLAEKFNKILEMQKDTAEEVNKMLPRLVCVCESSFQIKRDRSVTNVNILSSEFRVDSIGSNNEVLNSKDLSSDVSRADSEKVAMRNRLNQM